MKITIVQGAFLPVPPLLGGAVEKVWYDLGKEFARVGHEVVHISRAHPQLGRDEVADGVRYVRVEGFDAPGSLWQLKLADLLYSWRVLRVLPAADILVTNTFWMPLIAKPARHGKIYVHAARHPRGQMRFYRKAARLQTVSSYTGEAIRREVPTLANRVSVIPYFVPLPSRPPAPVKRLRQILYVGRIHPEKGLHLLIEAFRTLNMQGLEGWRLCIVGPWEKEYGGGGRGYREQLNTAAGGSAPLIDWTGPVFDSGKLGEYYRSSSVFVYPSVATGETFGLAPLEALAQGCPAVVSSLECFMDFIAPGENGWVFDHRVSDPGSELARVLATVMSDEGRLEAASRNATATAARFSLESVAQRYLDDFRAVTGAA